MSEIPLGNNIQSVVYNHSYNARVDKLLTDIEGFFVVDANGYYIDVGGGVNNGNGIPSVTLDPYTPTGGSIPLGNHIPTVSWGAL